MARVRRYYGTEAALMNGQPLVNVDESAPLRPDSRAGYPASKAAAEQVVIEANGSLETVVLRPRFVWGAGDTTLLPELHIRTVEGAETFDHLTFDQGIARLQELFQAQDSTSGQDDKSCGDTEDRQG